MPKPRSTNYPDGATLVEWMRELGSYAKVSERCGVARGSLRDYLKRRPDLKAQMDEHMPSKLTPEQRLANNRRAQREYQRRMQRENPERKREINRAWGKKQSPEQRAKWNNYNRERRAHTERVRKHNVPAHLLIDPCSYCGDPGGTVDHIVPVHHGGTSEPHNLTAACHSCNASKKARPLLMFLLDTREEVSM